MANEKIVQIPLANVARVELVTEETTPKTYVVDTANEMKLEAFVSEGEEKELRKLNRLLAQLKTEDLTKGYDLTMKDMVMSPPVFALVDGGRTLTVFAGEFQITRRLSVAVLLLGIDVDRERRSVHHLAHLRTRVSFKHCKGTPADIEIKDGDFFAPEYKLKSRPKIGESPIAITPLDELPT